MRVYPFTGQPSLALNSTNWFRIVNRHSGKVLDVSGPSTADGANIHQWDWVGGSNQQWRFEPGGDGAYKLIARHSNKACEVTGASWANGANVQQYTTNGTPAQEWWAVPAGGGYYKILNRETGRVLDVQSSGTTNGAVWGCGRMGLLMRLPIQSGRSIMAQLKSLMATIRNMSSSVMQRPKQLNGNQHQ